MGTQSEWYYCNSGPDSHQQALVIDEGDGRNVAVVYDRKDAPLLSAAPDLLAACRAMLRDYEERPYIGNLASVGLAKTALKLAKGGE